MTVTVQSFRDSFRPLANPAFSPDDAVTYYIGRATTMLAGSASASGNRFDSDTLDRAIGLYVAHYLVLDARDMAATINGGIPGEIEGPSTSQTADKVSFTQDTKAVTRDNEPFWNQTRYGVELMDLVYMYGAGPIQLGTPGSGDADSFGWGTFW